MASSISRRLCRSLFSKPTFKPSTPLPPQLSTRFFCSTLSSPENSDFDNSTVEPPDPTPDYDSHTSPSDSSQQRAFYDRPLENGLDPGIYKAILVGQVGQIPIQKRLRSGRTVTLLSFMPPYIDNTSVAVIVPHFYFDSDVQVISCFSSLLSLYTGAKTNKKVIIMFGYKQAGVYRQGGKSSVTTTKKAFLDISIDGEPIGRIVIGLFGTTKNVEGSVSIILRDPLKPPPKLKLVARKGKLEIEEEEVGTEPNGTEFLIATKDSPELDAAALVVGRVLEGMEVVHRIGQVKTVQENSSSPYFRVAKLIGDKRAVVAERGFNRPYAKVVVSNCGLFD
ncbi:hypothetical protein RHSIM_Rhsim08G0138500 [Rhododendron simsii]|uniref:PPIase cyclophilin-type domain-containing protein n=1 Tax=Rhododendron simsii TaxID=118357 RepID=A0A834LIY0_RHOSS|nr:hypothetical protein RHSIM_Rhsim08G0138500 [Rhododendron simsii]